MHTVAVECGETLTEVHPKCGIVVAAHRELLDALAKDNKDTAV